MVEDAIKRNLVRLTGIGLVPIIRPPRVTADAYELCVEFVDTKGIADIIEFHVIRSGQPVAELPEIRKWFDETLDDVVQRAESRLAATRRRS